MRYFIYPSGFNGKVLGDIIHFFEPSTEIVYIDDKYQETSLESMADSIGDNYVLLASKKHRSNLESRCKQLGIKNFCDGISFFGEKNQAYLMQHLKNPSRAVGIYLGGFSEEKHLGTLDYELKNLGIEVFYILNSKETLEANKARIGNCVAIIAWHDFLAEIKDVAMFVTTNGGKTDRSVTNINLGHSLIHFPQLHYHYEEEKLYQSVLHEAYLENADYLVVSNHIDYEKFLRLRAKYSSHTQAIQNGYLGFDQIQTIESVKIPNKIILSPKKRPLNKEQLYNLIEVLIQEVSLHIVLRFHPTEREQIVEEEALKKFGKNGNFSVDTEARLSHKLKGECLSIVTDFSTIAYSFPLSVLRPAIIYGIKEDLSNEESFVNDKLHIHARSPQEVRESLLKIQKNLQLYRDNIKQYKEEILYPTANASQNLALKLIEIMDKK